jgi:hypothetical protein
MIDHEHRILIFLPYFSFKKNVQYECKPLTHKYAFDCKFAGIFISVLLVYLVCFVKAFITMTYMDNKKSNFKRNTGIKVQNKRTHCQCSLVEMDNHCNELNKWMGRVHPSKMYSNDNTSLGFYFKQGRFSKADT